MRLRGAIVREHGFVEGTTGITFVHKKDKRRHRKHCIHYHKDGSCAYMSRCGGAAHCPFYSEEESKITTSYTTKDEKKIKKIILEEKNDGVIEFTGIQEIQMTEIVVPDKFLRKKPHPQKVRELFDYYKKNGKMDKPIYVTIKDGKYHLEDKYLRYYVAKKFGVKWISARIGTYEQSILGDRLHKIGGRVKHERFGLGTIVKNDGKYITVLFDKGKEIQFDFELCIRKSLLN